MPSPLKPPPGPVGFPFFGVLGEFRKNPADFLLRVAKQYGDTSHFRLGMQQVYFINRPELIDEVLVSGAGSFRKSRMLQRAKGLLGEGLLTAEGQFHIQQRKAIQPAFYRERLAMYAATMVSLADRHASRWKDGVEFDMGDQMMRVTLAIVCQTLFSRDIEDDASQIGKALTDVLSTFESMLSPFAPIRERLRFGVMARAEKAQRILDEKIYAIISEHRAANADRGDLLSTLIESMPDKQVRDEALTLMLAGHETTATALTWTWYLLAKNPEAEARLRDEWRTVLNGRVPTFDDVPALEYTERVFAESMRLYPPAWAVGRQALHEFRMPNFVIPKDAIVIMSPYVMHRHPGFWPKPEQFNPDRFTPELRSVRPKFSYFPFGGGPRTCIGERFAWMEGVLLLATIGQGWRFRLTSDRPAEIHPQITLRPRNGMKMLAHRVLA